MTFSAQIKITNFTNLTSPHVTMKRTGNARCAIVAAEENAPIVSGAIYRGDLTTDQGALLVEPAAEQMAVGLTLDLRTYYLFVVGGMMGDMRVYDATNGKLCQHYVVGEERSGLRSVSFMQWSYASSGLAKRV